MRKIASLPIGVLLLLLSLGLFSFLPDAAADDDDGCDKESIVALGDTPIQGNAFLCIDLQGVRAKLHARELTPETLTPSGLYTLTTLPMCHSRPVWCSGGRRQCEPRGCLGPPGLSGRTSQRQGELLGSRRWPAPLQWVAGLLLYGETRAGECER